MSITYTVDLSVRCDKRTAQACRASQSFSLHADRRAAKLAAMRAGWFIGQRRAVCPACSIVTKKETP